MTTRARWCAHDESGFSLVEAVVALFVLGIIFTALAGASIGALRASLTARAEQQALDFATERLEAARALDYFALAHAADDLLGDERVEACAEGTCFDPGTGVAEPVVVDPAGALAPHVSEVDLELSNSLPITLSTYVTRPDDSTAEYKRVTVIASWTMGAVARERVVSSLVTITTRGLPVPLFTFTPLAGTAASVQPGAEAAFSFELANQGAPDRWNLELTGAGATQWSLFRDDGDGVWEDSGVDLPLTNTNSGEDSLPDTDRIDPTGSIVIWAVRDVGASTVPGTYVTTLTATSVAQATAVNAGASVDLAVQVVASGTPIEDDPQGGQVGAAPGAPEGLQVTSGDHRLFANWSPPLLSGSSPVTDYVISYQLAGGQSWFVFNDGVSTATTATIVPLFNSVTYNISVAAVNAAGPGAQAAIVQGTPVSGITYDAPDRCPAGSLAVPTRSNSTFNLRKYALHNRSAANPTWPGTGAIAATSTIGQGLPLVAAVDGPQVPSRTNLPVYSSDIDDEKPGRILLAGGSLTTSDTTRVVDWRSTAASKAYGGTAVVGLWVAPVSTDDESLPWSITAQVYYRKSDGTLVALTDTPVSAGGGPGSFGPGGCAGWQEVWMAFPISVNLKANEYIGVRVWNPGNAGEMSQVRVAFDVVDDFYAYLIVPEKP